MDAVIKNGKPAFQTLILGVRCRRFRGGTCACHGALFPLHYCPALLRDSGSEPNRLGLSGQGRQGQRMLSPGRIRLAPSSGGPVRPAPTGSHTPQASAPPAASAVALDRPGASRGATGPARLTARRLLTHPQPQPPRPAHNIRPAFRLRHPSRAKPRARSRARRSSNRARAYAQTSTGPWQQKTLPPTPTLPPRYSPLFRLTDQLFPKPAFPSPVEAGDYILIGS